MADSEKIEAVAAPAPAVADEAPTVSAPKKRGRPPKNPPANGEANPVSESEAAVKGRPGRPKKKGKVNFTGDDLSVLAKQVEGLHQLMALATGIPELAIKTEEAQLLGGAIAQVAQEYDLEMSGKTGAMLQLIAVCGMIYVPKFGALKSRIAENKAQREQKVALHVVGSEAPAN